MNVRADLGLSAERSRKRKPSAFGLDSLELRSCFVNAADIDTAPGSGLPADKSMTYGETCPSPDQLRRFCIPLSVVSNARDT